MKQGKEGAPKVGFWRRAIAGFLVTLEKSLHWGFEGGCPSPISSAPSTLLTSSSFLKVGRLAYQQLSFETYRERSQLNHACNGL